MSDLPCAQAQTTRVLVVEDEPKVANALCEGLTGEGFDVAVEQTGEGAFFRISTEPIDIILLDLGLPGCSGLDVLRASRRRDLRTPVLLLTARDTVAQRVEGLDAGADDYLVKPFAFAELLARMRALLRRGNAGYVGVLRAGDLTIDLTSRRVERAGRWIDVTAREFELLEYLVRHRGEVVSRELLARDVWREPARSTPLDNVIDVHLTRLRRKLDEVGQPPLIQTIRGVGFMVAPP
jgi:two-component system copper resistance phosphate regulon response regulator CusR